MTELVFPRIPIENWSDEELKKFVFDYSNDDYHTEPFETFAKALIESSKRGFSNEELVSWVQGVN